MSPLTVDDPPTLDALPRSMARADRRPHRSLSRAFILALALITPACVILAGCAGSPQPMLPNIVVGSSTPIPTGQLRTGAPVTSGGTLGTVSWAVVDVHSGRIMRSQDSWAGDPYGTALIRLWLGADYLNRHPKPTSWRLTEINKMITKANVDAADDLYSVDGDDLGITRMVRRCKLTHTWPAHRSWQRTETTTGDMALLGACLASGRATNARWTALILAEMHTPALAFGASVVFPTVDVASLNGWTESAGRIHMQCLAIISGALVLTIVLDYPAASGVIHGAEQCGTVAANLIITT